MVEHNYLFKCGTCFNQFVLEAGQRHSERKARNMGVDIKYAITLKPTV